MNIRTAVAVTLAVVTLVGCGGGGSGDLPTPPQQQVVQQASKYNSLVVTTATTAPIPVSNAKDRRNLAMYNNVRSFAYGDFNGDGCTDMFVAPSYADHKPNLPVEVWLGDCKGGFAQATSSVIAGIVPTTGAVNNIFIADFNGDGKDDVLIIDQGLEDKDVNNPGFDGGVNQLLLSDGAGRLVPQATTFMDDNGLRFNHLSAIGDLNGDGKLDLVLVRLGGLNQPLVGTGGVKIYLGDGAGHFTNNTTTLPTEVVAPGNAFQAGGASIADLDGDGKPEIILTTYTNAIQQTAILKLNGQGKYDIVKRYDITPSLSNIGYNAATKVLATDNRGLGGSSMAVGDFNGDGKKDIAILWEGAGKSAIQVLKNNGNFDFTDVTDTWLNGIVVDHAVGGGSVPVSRLSVADVNNDGVDDLVAESMMYSANDLATRSPYLVFANTAGKFKFQSVLDTTSADFAAFIKQTSADAQVGLKAVDLNRDKKYDVLVVDWAQSGEAMISSIFSYFANTKFYAATAK